MCIESQGFGKFSGICGLLKITSKREYVKIVIKPGFHKANSDHDNDKF